jgi:deoxyribonuclease V
MEKIAEQVLTQKMDFPYIPGLLALREGPIIYELISRMAKPDIILLDGQGIAHPRKFGLASEVGLMVGIPTIGVAKSRLIGDVKEGYLYIDKKRVGGILEYGSRTLYVSPGHGITVASALKIVKDCIQKGVLPTFEAHKLANKRKNELIT